ncbi:hypothetical protein Zmor_019513 [Zophobas morio]|uniref:Uncharacterized protein n=1 Tax=Zophobas morio TaxID=2755281 RepID=A0AA38M8W1_9CUCU|nr:hypothetical protein Zmor_019513 [Zophobas morio]
MDEETGSSVCSFPTVLKVYKAIAKTPFYLYNNGAENQSNVAIMATTTKYVGKLPLVSRKRIKIVINNELHANLAKLRSDSLDSRIPSLTSHDEVAKHQLLVDRSTLQNKPEAKSKSFSDKFKQDSHTIEDANRVTVPPKFGRLSYINDQ